MSKTIYNYHPETGKFTGLTSADVSPLEPGVFLVPANATTDAPPNCSATEYPIFKEGAWIIETMPKPEAVAEKTQAEIDAENLAAYRRLAQAALDRSDLTLLRCLESSIAVPAEWAVYRKALRVAVTLETGDPSQPLPDRPAYPAGT